MLFGLPVGLWLPGGTLAAMKAVYPYEELAQISAAFKLRDVVPLYARGTTGAPHCLVFTCGSAIVRMTLVETAAPPALACGLARGNPYQSTPRRPT